MAVMFLGVTYCLVRGFVLFGTTCRGHHLSKRPRIPEENERIFILNSQLQGMFILAGCVLKCCKFFLNF